MKNIILLALLVPILAACATQPKNSGQATAAPAKASKTIYPDRGLAPEITNQVWINTDKPLRLADLRGKVVLLEMWTFDCINCQHVLPYLETWYQKYAPEGLVVIGNHFPEFSYERDLGNLKQAVQRLNIQYPVDQDNDGVTWNAYHNLYWPTAYLIDKNGHIRYQTIGEGQYAETEAAIVALLKE